MNELLRRYVCLQCTPDEISVVHEYLEADFSRCFDVIEMMRERAENDLSVLSGNRSLCYDLQHLKLTNEVPSESRSEYAPPRRKLSFLGDFRRKIQDFINEGEEEDESFEADVETTGQESTSRFVMEREVTASGFMVWLNDYLETDD